MSIAHPVGAASIASGRLASTTAASVTGAVIVSRENDDAPLVELRRLWAAVHAYLVVQAGDPPGSPPNTADLARAYSELVAAHNTIYGIWIAPLEPTPEPIAGLD